MNALGWLGLGLGALVALAFAAVVIWLVGMLLLWLLRTLAARRAPPKALPPPERRHATPAFADSWDTSFGTRPGDSAFLDGRFGYSPNVEWPSANTPVRSLVERPAAGSSAAVPVGARGTIVEVMEAPRVISYLVAFTGDDGQVSATAILLRGEFEVLG